MLILNNLTKQGTCDSVVVVEGKVSLTRFVSSKELMEAKEDG